MIKAVEEHWDNRLLPVGLSGENVTRPCAGEPIMIDDAERGVDAKVVIMYGRTEQDIVEERRANRVAATPATRQQGEGN